MNLAQAKSLTYGTPIWNTITKRRERFQELTSDGMVVTMTNNECITCPDYWHVTQIEPVERWATIEARQKTRQLAGV